MVGRSQLWFARAVRLTGLALTIGSIVAVLPLLVLISYPGGEPFWNAYFQAVPFGITILFIVMILPGILLSLIGVAISPPDPRLDFWLDFHRFGKNFSSHLQSEPIGGGVWAVFTTDRPTALGWTLGARGKCLVKFEVRFISLEQQGKDLVLVEPKTVWRTSTATLQVETGRWNYGKLTLTFDSASDADTVELEARKRVGPKDGIRYQFRQLPPFIP